LQEKRWEKRKKGKKGGKKVSGTFFLPGNDNLRTAITGSSHDEENNREALFVKRET